MLLLLLLPNHINNKMPLTPQTCSPFSSVLEFVCLPWSEVCSARVTSLLLLLLLLLTPHTRSITQGNGGQDREIQSRINTASQVFRSLKNSVFTSNHVDLNSKLHFYSCLELSHLMYGAAESWALTGSQAAQLETFHNSCMRRMMGRYRGTGGPPQLSCQTGPGRCPSPNYSAATGSGGWGVQPASRRPPSSTNCFMQTTSRGAQGL